MSIFFLNEITASDAGPDIIRSHLFWFFLSSKIPLHPLKRIQENFVVNWGIIKYFIGVHFDCIFSFVLLNWEMGV